MPTARSFTEDALGARAKTRAPSFSTAVIGEILCEAMRNGLH